MKCCDNYDECNRDITFGKLKAELKGKGELDGNNILLYKKENIGRCCDVQTRVVFVQN